MHVQRQEPHLAAGMGALVPKRSIPMAVGRAISVSLVILAVRVPVWCRALCMYAQLYEAR